MMTEEETNTQGKPPIKLVETPEVPRLTQDFGSLLPDSTKSSVPEVKKPDPQAFIRVHPTWNLPCYIFEDTTNQLTYLVSLHLNERYSDILHKKILYPAITRYQILFFWSVNMGRRYNTWNRSAMEAVQLAKTTWIRVSPDNTSRTYKTYLAEGEIQEPQFPSEKELGDLLLTAFQDRIIMDEDHPSLRRIRGLDP